MKLPSNPDLAFVPLPQTSAIVVGPNKVRKPLGLYAFDGDVYVKWGGGYIQVTQTHLAYSKPDKPAFYTSVEGVWVQAVAGDSVHVVKRANGQLYIEPIEGAEEHARKTMENSQKR